MLRRRNRLAEISGLFTMGWIGGMHRGMWEHGREGDAQMDVGGSHGPASSKLDTDRLLNLFCICFR